MRKRRQPHRAPDGMDWRDPDMPVPMRFIISGTLVVKNCPPQVRQLWSESIIRDTMAPHWSQDPSYNWRRK